MKLKLYILKVIILFSFVFTRIYCSHAQETKKVLFLGNSYTANNNLPGIVNNMAASTGDVLVHDRHTPGGFRLMQHASHHISNNKINSNDWDFVVLQAQSQETSWSQYQMQIELYPYAETLCNTIRTNNSCTIPLFYMTWGRENGDANNCPSIPWVCTYEGMDDAIRDTYILMGEQNNAQVSPAGAVWRYLRINNPDIDLYTGDSSHPTLIGSYATACAFYTMIYKKDPTLITWNSTLSEETANIIKLAAKSVVFDTIDTWDFTAYFNHSILDDNNVTFLTENTFDSLTWDFGDSNTSTLVNPTHTYLNIGEYNVTLTATKCGIEYTYMKTVNITALSIASVTSEQILIYPNPVENQIIIKKNKNTQLLYGDIFDIHGKLILKVKNDLKTIDVQKLQSGTYFIKLYSKDGITTSKFIKK